MVPGCSSPTCSRQCASCRSSSGLTTTVPRRRPRVRRKTQARRRLPLRAHLRPRLALPLPRTRNRPAPPGRVAEAPPAPYVATARSTAADDGPCPAANRLPAAGARTHWRSARTSRRARRSCVRTPRTRGESAEVGNPRSRTHFPGPRTGRSTGYELASSQALAGPRYCDRNPAGWAP